MPGPDREFSTDDVLTYLKTGGRPAYSVQNVAEHFDVTRIPAQNRVEELEEAGEVAYVTIGGTKAYFVPGEAGAPHDPVDADLDRREYHERSLRQWATDRFVGLSRDPWTAIHPNDGPAVGGDKIQLRVEGEPGNWRARTGRWHWENRREELPRDELVSDETQALISGELYEKPTVPVEHLNYPDDYDLEGEIGAEYHSPDDGSPALIAVGFKNYWIKPCNNAVFLSGVRVDWISPQGEAGTVASPDFDELVGDVEDWRAENIDESEQTERQRESLNAMRDPPENRNTGDSGE